MSLLLDTGILYALADEDDDWHDRAVGYLEDVHEALLTPVTVVPEAAWLIRTRLGEGAELAFVRSIARGDLQVEPLAAPDLRRSAVLLERHPFLGFVDASVIAVAERLRVETIATTDRRDFSAIRPAHIKSFRLVP
jgi:predicted nucleic acid-binding protein